QSLCLSHTLLKLGGRDSCNGLPERQKHGKVSSYRKRGLSMQADFQVESRSYDQMVRGRWRGYRLSAGTRLGDESEVEVASDCVRLWLPACTPMNWSTATRPLRSNCVQFFWPERWYTLSAFYSGRELVHTYASIISPATIELDRLTYVDLDLSLLVKPD